MSLIKFLNYVVEKGKTDFFKIRFELAMWVSNIRTELAPEINLLQSKKP